MNKSRQHDIKRFCKETFSQALTRFGTIECYERFVRGFYSEHSRYPVASEWGKRHGEDARKSRRVVRQKWSERRGFSVPSLAGLIRKARRAQRDSMRGEA